MANFQPICEWVLRLEDSTLSGKVVNLYDGQGLTRFGIAQHAHPEVQPEFYTCEPTVALGIAERIYKLNYWDSFWGDMIQDDGVASCLLSFSINDGEMREVMILQQVLGFTQTDGLMGPLTIEAVNRMGAALA